MSWYVLSAGRERGGNCPFPESASGQKGAGGSVFIAEPAVESGWKLEKRQIKETVSRTMSFCRANIQGFCQRHWRNTARLSGLWKPGYLISVYPEGGGVPARAMRGAPPCLVLRLQDRVTGCSRITRGPLAGREIR